MNCFKFIMPREVLSTIATSTLLKPGKMWSEESMKAAVTSVINDTLALR